MLCFSMIVILSWFVDSSIVNAAIKYDQLIEEEDVECRPEKIPCSVLDENVNICLVRPYFTADAWMIVEEIMKKKRELDIWYCVSCQDSLDWKLSIICELCLQWYHFVCVGLTTQPKKKNWFCRNCTMNNNKC